MRKNLILTALAGSVLMFIVIVIGSVVIVAQTAVTGTWTADTRTGKEDKEDTGKIHLSFERRTENGHNQNGQSYSYDDIKGLTRDRAENGKVSFRLVREAGTVECEGSFVNGKGSGTFTFTPDAGYVGAMKARGFDFERSASKHDDGIEGKLLSAALLNVTTALADDLNSANFGKLEVEDLFKAAIFKVDSKFMADMKATGFPNLTMEDLVKARIFKIDPEYVRQVHDMGFDKQEFEGLVKFRIFKVTPEYLSELKAEGLNNLSSEDVVKCRIFKIEPDFIRKAKAEDPNVTVEELVRMKIGVRRVKDTN